MVLTQILLSPIVFSPIVATIIASILKVIIYSTKHSNFKTEFLYRPEGVPSTQSAFLAALAASIFTQEGMTTLFLAVVALLILMISNLLIQPQHKKKDKSEEVLSHSISGIIVGLIIGIFTGILLTFYL